MQFPRKPSFFFLLKMLHANPASAPLLSHYDEPNLKEGNKGEALTVDQSGQSFFSEAIKLAFHCCWCFLYKAVMCTCPPLLSEMKEEMKHLFTLALPLIITSLLIYGKMAISVHFLGKIDKDTLAGGSLAIGVANITGYSVISGLAAGMEGISSQAYGARQWKLITQTLQCTIVFLIIACISIAILWLNIEPILHLWGQNPSISSIATTYLAFSLPDLFFQALINPIKIYLRAQNVTIPLMSSAGLSLVLHVTINYVIVHYFSLGIRGIALASDITSLNLLLILLLYLWFSGECSHSSPGWSFECFNQWKPILHQAIPSCVSVCLEWWWYEILILLSGLLNNATDTVAASGIIIQATALIYNFPFALSLAVSTRVGNELGANQPSKAKTSSVTALCCAFFIGIIGFAMMLAVTVRSTWGRIFTEDQAILSLLASSLPVVGAGEIANCPQTTICGVLRGSARPTLGAYINFVSFYVVGLPVAIVMGFVFKLGLMGLWMGLLSAQIVCATVMVTVLIITDWKGQADRARELISRENVSREENNEAMEALISVQLLN